VLIGSAPIADHRSSDYTEVAQAREKAAMICVLIARFLEPLSRCFCCFCRKLSASGDHSAAGILGFRAAWQRKNSGRWPANPSPAGAIRDLMAKKRSSL